MIRHLSGTVGINRNRANAAFMLGLFTIIAALASQYIGGLYPCELCLTQRLPYYIGLPALAVVIFAWNIVPEPIRVGLTLAVAAIFAWGAGLGVYHSGVEWGIFQGPTACSGTGEANVSLDMLSDLSGAQVVPCDAVQFEVLGISLAGFNAIISAIIVVLLAMSAWGQFKRLRR